MHLFGFKQSLLTEPLIIELRKETMQNNTLILIIPTHLKSMQAAK